MTAPETNVLLVAAYAVFLLVAAFGFDAMARRMAVRSQRWRTGLFLYHADHDAWRCPEDQWLWPTAFDPEQRTMRYRASPVVCNSCPVKSTCTTSNNGREVVREVDPWPHSEAGRFHRGIACAIALLAVLLPLGMLLGRHSVPDVLVLAGTALVAAVAGSRLAAHLWNAPSGFPDHVRHQVGASPELEAIVDRYATNWGVRGSQKERRT